MPTFGCCAASSRELCARCFGTGQWALGAGRWAPDTACWIVAAGIEPCTQAQSACTFLHGQVVVFQSRRIKRDEPVLPRVEERVQGVSVAAHMYQGVQQ